MKRVIFILLLAGMLSAKEADMKISDITYQGNKGTSIGTGIKGKSGLKSSMPDWYNNEYQNYMKGNANALDIGNSNMPVAAIGLDVPPEAVGNVVAGRKSSSSKPAPFFGGTPATDTRYTTSIKPAPFFSGINPATGARYTTPISVQPAGDIYGAVGPRFWPEATVWSGDMAQVGFDPTQPLYDNNPHPYRLPVFKISNPSTGGGGGSSWWSGGGGGGGYGGGGGGGGYSQPYYQYPDWATRLLSLNANR
jgi:hypothetical protein